MNIFAALEQAISELTYGPIGGTFFAVAGLATWLFWKRNKSQRYLTYYRIAMLVAIAIVVALAVRALLR